MEGDRAGIAEQAREDAVQTRMLALAEEMGVPVQTAYVDGPAPPWPLTVVVFGNHAGLAADDDRGDFRERFTSREGQAVRGMADGELAEHLNRLRRVNVMASEDGLPDWYQDLTRERFTLAESEMRWRKRAETKGGPAIDRRAAWRERVEKLKASVDLAMLIAYECDKAKPVGLGKWQCCCPFHADRSPSLSIDVSKGLWHCHGCQVGGDAFTYVELRYGLDFAAAVEHLEQRL